MVAICEGKESVAQILIDAGADVNLQGQLEDKAGRQINVKTLQVASGMGRKDIVQMLLEAGADVQAQGRVALQLALLRNDEEIVQMLRDAGATEV